MPVTKIPGPKGKGRWKASYYGQTKTFASEGAANKWAEKIKQEYSAYKKGRPRRKGPFPRRGGGNGERVA